MRSPETTSRKVNVASLGVDVGVGPGVPMDGGEGDNQDVVAENSEGTSQ